MCPQCQDTYWKPVVVDGVERVVRCDCWRDRCRRQSCWPRRGIPPRFGRAELENFEHDMDTQRSAWQKATAFVDAFPVVDRGLCPVRTARRRQDPPGGRHPEGRAFAKRARAAFSSRPASSCASCATPTTARSKRPRWKCSNPLLDADLLVLDDLGAERTSEWVQETLGLVVNARYNEQAPHDLHEQPRRHRRQHRSATRSSFSSGPRTRSRLVEMCDWVEIQRRRHSRRRPARVVARHRALEGDLAGVARNVEPKPAALP